ncbi:MAG: DUF655 domain-containing protein [Acidilobaceae archaeon]
MDEQEARRGSTKGQHPAALEVEAVTLDYIPQGLYNDQHREHRDRPVAQAVGVRRFTFVDGIPLADVEPLQRVTLARSVVRTIVLPDARGQRIRRQTVLLACLPGPERLIYCYSLTPLDRAGGEALAATIQEEGGWALIVDSPAELSKIAQEKGLSPTLLVVPYTPLKYGELTDIAKNNLLEALKTIIAAEERFYVEFFNVADAINIRLHVLELFKGVGKKTLANFIDKRKQKPFENFEEVKRVLKIDPLQSLAEKIAEELRGEAKYCLFVDPETQETPYLGYLDKMRRSYYSKRRAQ